MKHLSRTLTLSVAALGLMAAPAFAQTTEDMKDKAVDTTQEKAPDVVKDKAADTVKEKMSPYNESGMTDMDKDKVMDDSVGETWEDQTEDEMKDESEDEISDNPYGIFKRDTTDPATTTAPEDNCPTGTVVQSGGSCMVPDNYGVDE